MRGAGTATGLIAALLATSVMAADPVVAARTLRPGTILTQGDLSGEVGMQVQINVYLGLEVRRTIFVGRPVHPEDLGPATLVQRNSVVEMRYRDGALAIRTEGRALDAGSEGERIRVMNLDTRTQVVAVVSGPGQVEVRR